MENLKTIEYYNQISKEFIEATVNVDFTETQNKFLRFLPKEAHILDFGCGSGRDTKYFLDKGFKVTAVDGSIEFCKFTSKYTGIDVKHMYFQDLTGVEVYDAIWACSSILHLPYDELIDVMLKMTQSLKNGGIIYTSFKYGVFEGERNGRHFTDMTEDKFQMLLKNVAGLEIEELWITGDVRAGRGEEKWLNLILKKI